MQWTTGRLNYINGYTTKAQDSMDFRLDSETGYAGPHGRWLTDYRLLSRKTVCIPEVALWFQEAEPMVRSFRIWKCYAPIAWSRSLHSRQSCLLEGLPRSREKQLDDIRTLKVASARQNGRCNRIEFPARG